MKYLISKEQISFCVNKEIYNVDSLMKGAYQFIDRYYIFFEQINELINIEFSYKNEAITEEIAIRDIRNFMNEVLHQKIRKSIVSETRHLRELIMGRALYSACIDISTDLNNYNIDSKNIINKTVSLDSLSEISLDWFENEGNRK